MFIAISGISGSGKSTIGQALATTLNLTYVDQDSYFIPQKPSITMSDGSMVKNWDCMDALDIHSLKHTIIQLAPNGLILVGFALRDEVFPFPPTCHIHLSTGSLKSQIIERSIASRQQSKGAKRIDELMVREVVYPFYQDTISKSTIDYIIEVYKDDDSRKTVNEIMNEILWILKDY
jgi:uridine kinase